MTAVETMTTMETSTTPEPKVSRSPLVNHVGNIRMRHQPATPATGGQSPRTVREEGALHD
jgi:hypothetical protein